MASELAIPKKHLDMAAKAILDGELDGDLASSDPEAVTRLILERILSAETFADAFAPQTLTAWREYEGVPVMVTDFRFNRSTVKGGSGSPIYAVVDIARLDTGEALTVSVGGRNVLAQLLMMAKNGWLDNPVAITSKETGDGYNVLWLVDARHDAEIAQAKAAAASDEHPDL